MPPTKGPDPQASLDYLLLLISKSDFKPNYQATAEASGIPSANNAQKKYKKIVEQDGNYKLVKGSLVAVAAEGDEEGDED